MNADMMNILLRSSDISAYILDISLELLNIYIHASHSLVCFSNDKNTTKVRELEFYISADTINKTLNIIKNNQ